MIARPALAGWAALAAVPAFGQPAAPVPEKNGPMPLRSGPVLEKIVEIPRALRACWQVPPALRGFERLEATVRFSLRVDGALIGEQRLTYVASPVDGRARDLLGRSVLEAVRTCSPLPLGEGLGRAIAGRVFTVRFVYSGPKGRGA